MAILIFYYKNAKCVCQIGYFSYICIVIVLRNPKIKSFESKKRDIYSSCRALYGIYQIERGNLPLHTYRRY